MKNLILILICLISLRLYPQSIEIIGGLNKNVFFDFYEASGYYRSSYTSEWGYSGLICIEDIKLDWWSLRFTLGFDKYGGTFTASDGSAGGSHTTIADIDKYIIYLGLYPINFKIIKRIDLNFGFVPSILVHEKFSGTSSVILFEDSGWRDDLNDRYDKFSSTLYVGFKGRIAYDFYLSDNLILSPQYSFYIGLSNEFIEFPEYTKSMRHYFCLGIQKKIK